MLSTVEMPLLILWKAWSKVFTAIKKSIRRAILISQMTFMLHVNRRTIYFWVSYDVEFRANEI